MWETLTDLWPHLLAGFTLAVDLVATGHVILYKRDVRAAIGWAGLIWFVPILGSLFYLWLGINRIERRARSLRPLLQVPRPALSDADIDPERVPEAAGDPHLEPLVRMVGQVTGYPLLDGNRITPLPGASAYVQMLAAIEAAERSVTLMTYIFDNDPVGRRFVNALSGAVKRGVHVRVIVDDIGAKYTFPSILKALRRAGIPTAVFMPRMLPWAFAYGNLRNHRKILVVDGCLGFTGGMNIRQGHVGRLEGPGRIEDLHFKVSGPVVAHLQHTFAEDWYFLVKEKIEGPLWFPSLSRPGRVLARGIPDGPDEDLDNLRTTIQCALSCAKERVSIVTPYFLPDASLITALNLAAMRGVTVDILIPGKNNLKLVEWACAATIWQVLEHGCRVWLTPPPFDHTKLMVVDGLWTLLGSTNWDPRSLRLNFEFNVECHDRELARQLEALVGQKRQRAHRLTLAEADGRHLPRKLRDGAARLLSPYL